MATVTAVPADLQECIWHDPDGVWVDIGTGLHGPFDDEAAATRCAAAQLIAPVADALARLVDDDNAQGRACDLQAALSLLQAPGCCGECRGSDPLPAPFSIHEGV